MKTKTLFQAMLLGILLLYFSKVHAQLIDPIQCSTTFPITSSSNQTQSVQDSRFGWMHTPKGRLHVLVIFVGFTEMQNSSNDIYNSDGWWYHDQIPDWAKGASNKALDQDPNTIGNYPNLSSWYKTMSDGQFILTGEIIQDLIIVDRNTANNQPRDPLTINAEVISKLQALYPNKNWGEFDRRTNYTFNGFDNELYNDPNQTPASGDGMLDYVEILYQGGGGWSGVSGIYLDYTKYPLTTNYNNQTSTYQLRDGHSSFISQHSSHAHNVFFCHELSHNLFQNNHTFGANDAVGSHMYQQGGWGMTGYFFAPFWMANAWERWYLGWTSPQEISTNGTYELRDYVTENDALRIPIPGTNNSQYLWVENHSQFSDFDHRYIDLGEQNFPETSPGLYMFVSSIGSSHSSPVYIAPENTNCFKLLHADGNHDFLWTGQQNSGNRAFEKLAPNPISGINYCVAARQNDFDLDPTDIKFQNGTQGNFEGPNEHWRIWAEAQNGSTSTTYAATGDSRLPFGVGDEVGLSGIVPALNYATDELGHLVNTYLWTSVRKPGENKLNGLTVKILSYNSSTHTYTIQVQFDDFAVKNDKRWCGRISLENINSNSNTPDLSITNGSTITIDKSGTPNITRQYDDELDPPDGKFYQDFVVPTDFRCKTGAWMKVDGGSDLILDNQSVLTLEGGSKLELASGAEMFVRGGSRLVLNKSAVLALQNSARLVVEEDATLVYDQSSIQIEGTQAVIEVRGTIEIVGGSTFDYSYSSQPGYIHFVNTDAEHRNITGDGKFQLTGANNALKKLYVEGMAGINPSPSLTSFDLTYVQADMDAGAAMNFDCPVKLLYSNFNGISAFHFDGIYINGGAHEINGVTIDNANYGITWTSVAQTKKFKLRNSHFTNCETGLRTYGSSADMDIVYFLNNNTGWLADGMETASRLDRGIVNQNTDGVIYVGASAASTLGSKYSFVTSNTNGVFVRYSEFAPGCGSISNNGGDGVTLNSRASLNIDPNTNKFVGNMNLSSNAKAVVGNRNGALYLNNSNSNFASLTPDFAFYCLGLTQFVANPLPAKGNYWDHNGSAPTWFTNYEIFNTSSMAISIPQAGYLSTAPSNTLACYNYVWNDQSHASGLQDYVMFSNAGTVSISINTLPSVSSLFDAAVAVLDTLYTDSIGNNLPVVGIGKDIVTYDYHSDFNIALPTLLFVYDRMLEAYGKSVLEGQHTPVKDGSGADAYLQKILDTQDDLLSKLGTGSTNYEARFKVSLDKAMMLRLSGQRDDALTLLDAMLGWADQDNIEDITAWQCRINAEKALLAGNLNRKDLFDQIVNCGQSPMQHKNPVTNPFANLSNGAGLQLAGGSGTTQVNNNQESAILSTGDKVVSGMTGLKLYPNPAQNSVMVSVTKGSTLTSVSIMDMTGREMFKQEVNGSAAKLDISYLKQGAYTVKSETSSGAVMRRLTIMR